MTNYRFAFYTTEKQRTHDLAAIIAQGAARHDDKVEVLDQSTINEEVLKEFDGTAILGQARAAKRLLDHSVHSGKHCLMFDKGYMDRDNYLRVSVDSWSPTAYMMNFPRSDDRLKRHLDNRRFVIEPRRDNGPEAPVLIAGTCQSHCNFHELGDSNEYHTKIAYRLHKHTGRPIVYRPNHSWATRHPESVKPIPNTLWSPPTTPFTAEMKRSHIVITSGSSAAFVALAAGVPIMILKEGVAAPMALGSEEINRVDKPFWPEDKDRYQYFANAAYCQWTRDELRSGEAWEDIRLILMRQTPAQGECSMDDLITQYKAMHDNRKLFRGMGTAKYTDQIGELVKATGSKTLLDYGSGKGVQYGPDYILDQVWGVKVVCYDPAVEKFDKLPTGWFDTVICCDVMEHVPEPEVQKTLQRIFSYANYGVFFAIAISLAKKRLPDGRNCHLTVRPERWWWEQIAQARRATHKPDSFQVHLVTIANPRLAEGLAQDGADGEE